MFYLILIFLFVAVFGFLGWRIVKTHLIEPATKATAPPDRYVCPACNEHDCVCHKEFNDN